MTRVRRTWTVENTWQCSSCDTNNLGRDVVCSTCGSPKEPDEAENEAVDPNAEVTDPALLKLANEGVHWTCEYCGSNQRQPDGNCVQCAGAKSAEPTEASSGRPPIDVHGALSDRREAAVHARSHFDPVDFHRTRPEFAVGISRTKLIILAGVGFALIGIMWYLLAPHEMTAVVKDTQWFHTTSYEERIVKHDSSWGAVAGAFNVACDRRLKTHRNCDPYKCNPHQESYNCRPHDCRCHKSCTKGGNGFSHCREICSTCYATCTRTGYDTCYKRCPVYDDWCEYDYYKWEARGSRTASGHGHDGLNWLSLGPTDETHREQRHASYIVHWQHGSSISSRSPDTEIEFVRFHIDATWKGEKSIVGAFGPLQKL